MSVLLTDWIAAKAEEKAAQERRREIEDKLVIELGIDLQSEGTKHIDGFKITMRFNRKINSDLLQEIAAEHGLTAHLSSLFRWKPEINATAWKSASEEITKPLTAAITTTPGRPSFDVSTKETES
jgi:hypothetical protein